MGWFTADSNRFTESRHGKKKVIEIFLGSNKVE